MRHILQGFTMVINGLDYGIDCEEVELPLPTPLTQDYRGGGMDLGMTQPMAAIEALECTVKVAGQNPDIMGLMGRGPGLTTIVTFRGSVLREQDGGYATHLAVVQGAINAGSRDAWVRGEKSGLQFIMNGIKYMRYEADTRVIHELVAYPPRRIVNGVNQLSELNRALGYA